MSEELAHLIERLDTSEPGLYLVKLNKAVPMEVVKKISEKLNSVINEYAPGSKILVLDSHFDFVVKPSNEVLLEMMSKLEDKS